MDGGVEVTPLTVESLYEWAEGREHTDWMLPLFYSIARRYPKCQVGEIGMRGGTSTLAWLLATAKNGGHVWSMDLESCAETIDMFRTLDFDQHTFIQGNSQETDFPEGVFFDVLYIDGGHRYEEVQGDYERHIGRVKDGGIVLFHDTRSYPEVGIFVKQIGGFSIDIGAGLGFIMPNGPVCFRYEGTENYMNGIDLKNVSLIAAP